MKTFINALMVLVTALFLVACSTDGTNSDPADVNTDPITENLLPTAYAGGNKTVEVNASITITGSATDADGTIASYEWKEGNTSLSATAVFDFNSSVVGNHTLSLIVIDNDGATVTDTMVVSVTEVAPPAATNSAPTACAGNDITMYVNDTLTIVGCARDTDGTVVSYEWEEGTAFLANTLSFDYTPTSTGTHTLTLTVMDDDGDVGSDTMIVTVTNPPAANNPPTANAGVDKTIEVHNPVTVTATASDTDGTIASVAWAENGTFLADTLSFDYTPATAGTHTLTLTVTDDDGASHSDTMIVTVTNPPAVNNPPTANAGVDKSVEVNNPVTVTGTANDTDGTIASIEWAENGAFLANTLSFDYTPATAGTHTLTLTVTDDDGDVGSDTMIVTVTNPPAVNNPPTANAGVDKSVEVNTAVTVTGTASDTDGTIASVEWAENGAFLANTLSFDYTPATTGTHTLTLTVTDDDGDVGSDSMIVTATAAPVSTPIIDPIDTQTVNDNGGGLATTILTVTGTDIEAGATFSIVNDPTSGMLTIHPSTGELVWEGDIDIGTFSQSFTITVKVVNNSDSGSDTETFTLNVIDNA